MLVLVLKGAPHMAVVLVGEAGHGLLLLLVDHGGLIEGLLGQPRLADGGDAEIGEHGERWGWGGSRRSRGADGRAGRGYAMSPDAGKSADGRAEGAFGGRARRWKEAGRRQR